MYMYLLFSCARPGGIRVLKGQRVRFTDVLLALSAAAFQRAAIRQRNFDAVFAHEAKHDDASMLQPRLGNKTVRGVRRVMVLQHQRGHHHETTYTKAVVTVRDVFLVRNIQNMWRDKVRTRDSSLNLDDGDVDDIDVGDVEKNQSVTTI